MTELETMELAINYRRAAIFYGEAVEKSFQPTTKWHFTRLARLCEQRGFELEVSVVGEPVHEGGPLTGEVVRIS